MTETLISEKNPLLKQVRRAVSRGSLTDDGFAVAESFHLLEEALASRCEVHSVIVAESAQTGVSGYLGRLNRTRVVIVPDSVFAQIATTETTQGIIALVRPPAWTLDQLLSGRSLMMVLDGVQDPGNAGAILRAAEAFGSTGVAFLKGSVSPYNPKCLRSSAGSVFRLPIAVSVEDGLVLDAVARHGIALYAAQPRATKLVSSADLSASCAIIIGGEGRGVNPALRAHSTGLRIPTSGVESLNAAVAAGVLLYEAQRQRTES